ncbi:NAD(+)--rifampin ADP-ribosyltransferase [Terriglobus aquaticus]|uniref:NAD(+)--rifampin ADP-ribosyltransferase n=1 Tax=Terriglobus aquaticus TaxID=940139 RepID=A0ABW9KJA9_9BACT|nr:NAD(+)--rifampin ADP-ribosyltransferase [Terriglobus aquaticus]
MSEPATRFKQTFFHGTRASLVTGDFIQVGYASNFRDDAPLSWVYFAATLDAALWGAELAAGNNPSRIYVVEATGDIMDDPNLTNKMFPGNPTLSYRSRAPLRVLGEVVGWHGHPAEQLQQRKDRLGAQSPRGAHIID